MASVASQLIEEVTAHAQSDSLEDAREICTDGTYFPNNLRISDDAHSHLCGYAKKQHCQYWSNEQPCHMFRKLLHSLTVTTPCAMLAFGINGPHFFEEGNRRVLVNSA